MTINKIVLGIESSCDDSAVGIVDSNKNILANIVVSQLKEHKPYGGVVPEIAARAHMKNINYVISAALAEAKINLSQIDAVAATTGPGLIGGVIVGAMFAKAISASLDKAFISINHLEGHSLVARLTNHVEYPYLLLLTSGGHCQFIAVEDLGKYKILGQTLDDAVGEVFDKVAKMLNLGYPGGPVVEQLALLGDIEKYKFPLSMSGREGCSMSFSGLKTAVLKTVTSSNHYENFINDICASFQHTVARILAERSLNAIKIFREKYSSNNMVFSGGVAANKYIRSYLSKSINQLNFNLVTPPINLCTDNGVMIAWAGMERLYKGLTSDLSVCPRARWSLEDL